MKGYFRTIPKFLFPKQSQFNLYYMNTQILCSYMFIKSTSSLMKKITNSENNTIQSLISSNSLVMNNSQLSFIDLLNTINSMKNMLVLKDLISLVNICRSTLLTHPLNQIWMKESKEIVK